MAHCVRGHPIRLPAGRSPTRDDRRVGCEARKARGRIKASDSLRAAPSVSCPAPHTSSTHDTPARSQGQLWMPAVVKRPRLGTSCSSLKEVRPTRRRSRVPTLEQAPSRDLGSD